MSLQCQCSKKENCWRNGGQDDVCAGDYSIEMMLEMVQENINSKKIFNIVHTELSEKKAIIVGYIPEKACFWRVTIRHNEIGINFYGQFSGMTLSQSSRGDDLYNQLPGNNKSGGYYTNSYIELRRDAGNFNKSHCISGSDYMFCDIPLKDMFKDMINRASDFLSEFMHKTYAKLATKFRCQYIVMLFVTKCDVSQEIADYKNTAITVKFPLKMFSARTRLITMSQA